MEQELEDLQIDDETEEDEVLVEYDIATYPSDFTLSIIHKMGLMVISRSQSSSENSFGRLSSHRFL
jgi:hypothetical protein